jgi:hypothetical protein
MQHFNNGLKVGTVQYCAPFHFRISPEQCRFLRYVALESVSSIIYYFIRGNLVGSDPTLIGRSMIKETWQRLRADTAFPGDSCCNCR